MSKRKPAGKGISGFITGILLATVVIAAVLFLLNKSRESDFKDRQKPVEEAVQTEILQPKQEVLPPVQQASETFIEIVSEGDVSNGQGSPSGTSANKPAEEDRPSEKPADNPQPVQPEAKPAPEQILESGNIEKARKAAETERRRKAEAAAESRRVQAILNGKPSEQAAASAKNNKGKTIVQAGSYASQSDAEAQRAKLAMLGVNTRISQARVNGKTVYRVQTGALDNDAAAKTRRTLQQNGVDSFARSVE